MAIGSPNLFQQEREARALARARAAEEAETKTAADFAKVAGMTVQDNEKPRLSQQTLDHYRALLARTDIDPAWCAAVLEGPIGEALKRAGQHLGGDK